MMKVYKEIRKELEKYDKKLNLGTEGLSSKEEIIILTKADVLLDEKDSGKKIANVEITLGINNGVNILQQGAGNHTAAIQNLNGSSNNINIGQTGTGNHSLTITSAVGSINSGDTITATQSGGAGADKSFQLNLNGTSGATVNVQQTNPTTPNTGSMTIQCTTCGTYNYIRQ
jgi:hypothetical protein